MNSLLFNIAFNLILLLNEAVINDKLKDNDYISSDWESWIL